MSKYIRTKDEVREYEEVIKCIKYWHTNVVMSDDKDKNIKCDIETFNKLIIKQADTIEELCDEFVVITEAYRKVGSYYDCECEIKRYINKYNTNNHVIAIYGAIWTDKGLIYVAKMNEKGELELL